MTKDLLYQPPVFTVLEEIYYLLYTEGKQNDTQIVSYYLEDDKEIDSYLTPLKDLNLVKYDQGIVEALPGSVIKHWDKKTETFSQYFKLQILSSLTNATDKEIAYFAKFLADLFAKSIVRDEDIDRLLQKARKMVGIQENEKTTLEGKISYSKQVLRYLDLLYTYDNDSIKMHFVMIPQELVKLSLELAVEEICALTKIPYLDLYNDVFRHLNHDYYPCLNESRELLTSVSLAITKDDQISTKFAYQMIPDGGKELIINNTPYNKIYVEDR